MGCSELHPRAAGEDPRCEGGHDAHRIPWAERRDRPWSHAHGADAPGPLRVDRTRRDAGARPQVCTVDVDRKSTRLNSSHPSISYAVCCLKKKTASYTAKT